MVFVDKTSLNLPLRALDGLDKDFFFFFSFWALSGASPGVRPIRLFSNCKINIECYILIG